MINPYQILCTIQHSYDILDAWRRN